MTHASSVPLPARTRSVVDLARFRPPPPPRLESWLADLIPPDAPSINVGGRVPCLGEPLFSSVDPFEIVEAASPRRGRSDRWFWTLMEDMEAAYIRDVQRLDSLAVRGYLGLRDKPEVVSYTTTKLGQERQRSRSADRRIRAGREAWHQLGGVPWALVGTDELSRFGREWWFDADFIDNEFIPQVADWHEHHTGLARVRVERQVHELNQRRRRLAMMGEI